MTTNQQIQFAPFRPFNDFIGQAESYAIPDLKDLPRLNNRMTNNLLYYQTNYILVVLAFFVIMGIIHPAEFSTGLIMFFCLVCIYIYLTNRYTELQRLKRDKPFLSLLIIMLISGILFRYLGSLLIFLFSICLPLSLTLLHASLRLRNLKNKLANKVEMIGIARTPMGCLLEQLGATNEIAS